MVVFLRPVMHDEGTAEEVVANRISTSTVAGETLFTDETNANIEARDFEVSNAGSDGGEARMLIWDFNSEDLDEVAIFVDGMPVKEKSFYPITQQPSVSQFQASLRSME